MQVGDLVTFAFQRGIGMAMDVGLIVETGKWTGNADVKVLWTGSTEAVTQKSEHLKLIDNSLTQS
tara:strand:- start:172 stop:366 length:195 start_codon:yes stop_codon:yes gene_type:complete